MKILDILANPKPIDESNSRQLAELFFKELKDENPNINITRINLYEDLPPYFDYNNYRYFRHPSLYKPTKEETKAAQYGIRHIALFNSADILTITTAMWNFSVPAILKAWQDIIIHPRQTFSMGKHGVIPLHHIRKIILFLSSGGSYFNNPKMDNLTWQIKAAFGFIGIKSFETIWADGQTKHFYKDYSERKEKSQLKAKEAAHKILREELILTP